MRARRGSPGKSGGPISARGNGARSARTTATTATPGTTSRTTSLARVPTAGVRTGSGESPTTSSGCALRLRLWNERDPILKERLFGLTNSEGNHGEDVKEYYFYLDSTPTHSYMKYLYKYPQREFPYKDLVETNRGRSREEFEYELLDTGVFDDDRYFDVFVEYAKAGPEDMLIRITVHNRGPETARLQVLPTLWFRNTWSWGDDDRKPSLRQSAPGPFRPRTPNWAITGCTATGARSCCSPRTKPTPSVYGDSPIYRLRQGCVSHLCRLGTARAVNPAVGTKAAAHYALEVPAGGSQRVRLRLRLPLSDDAVHSSTQVSNGRMRRRRVLRADHA